MGRQRFNFWIDGDLRDGLRVVCRRDGILDSEQVRRAVKDWLKKKGVAEAVRTAPTGLQQSGRATRRAR
jgi:hypothetical protein